MSASEEAAAKKGRTDALELFYFDVPGKGESIRLFTKYTGLALKDNRCSREDFEAMRAHGQLAFDQFPVLLSEGHYIAQSAAILRFLGKLTGHYPSDPHAAALVDGVMDQEADMFAGLAASRYRDRMGFESLSDEAVVKVRAALNDRVLPRHLGYFERLLDNSATGWIAGTEEPSIADFCLVPRLQWLAGGNNDGISTDILKPFPHLISLIDRLTSLPALRM